MFTCIMYVVNKITFPEEDLEGGWGSQPPRSELFLACQFENSYGPDFWMILPPPPSRIPGSAPIIIIVT